MLVLDREQLRAVTMDDEELMRELVDALIQDTANQLPALREALSRADTSQLARLAHYSKGACANVGAQSVTDVLIRLEKTALGGDLTGCSASLSALATELDRLRAEVGAL